MFKVIGSSLVAVAGFVGADHELFGARHTDALLAMASGIARSLGF